MGAPETEILTYGLFIDGQWVDAADGGTVEVINPATEQVIGRVAQAGRADVRRAIEAARRAFDEGPWPRMSVRDRAAVMLRMVEIMERRKDELVDLNVRESGSTVPVAQGLQIGTPIAHLRDMVERIMPSFAWQTAMMPHIGHGVGQGVVLREPYGVAGLISAYNYPFLLNLFKVGPALAAGCTAVLKPAPTTPLEAFVIGEIAEEAGLPPGVLNIVTGDVEAGEELTTNRMVDLISFTGSDTVGKQVYAQAAQAPGLKKVILELGGKSANIITDDADLAKVIPDLVLNMVLHAGQGCGLQTRTLVPESRRDEFAEALVAALSQVTVGDPSDQSVAMGPVISAAQRDKIERLIAIGEQEGGKIVFGGGRPSHLEKGFFIEPTLFVDVDNDATIARTEFFGPVGTIMTFKDDADAIRIANESQYGLGGGVWAKDAARAYAIAKEIRTGTVLVNGGGGGISPWHSFGGYKESGLGREWGHYGLEEFLQSKSILWHVAGG